MKSRSAFSSHFWDAWPWFAVGLVYTLLIAYATDFVLQVARKTPARAAPRKPSVTCTLVRGDTDELDLSECVSQPSGKKFFSTPERVLETGDVVVCPHWTDEQAVNVKWALCYEVRASDGATRSFLVEYPYTREGVNRARSGARPFRNPRIPVVPIEDAGVEIVLGEPTPAKAYQFQSSQTGDLINSTNGK